MKRVDTELPGVCILEPKVFGDDRGFFLETYNERTLAGLGIDCRFVQDNHSRSRQGVLRGLHFQLGKPQAKLVRVVQGAVYDVAVDVRRGSPTFGKAVGVTLSAEDKRMFFVPEGFAHGFYVLTESAEFIYKCSDFYAPGEERGVIWNDPDLGIAWPLAAPQPLLSAKDQVYRRLRDMPEADLPRYSAAAAR
jgi:dTDP-4-dehydrorhamnose 3,5-epimerase